VFHTSHSFYSSFYNTITAVELHLRLKTVMRPRGADVAEAGFGTVIMSKVVDAVPDSFAMVIL
jgi:hypothetical protein